MNHWRLNVLIMANKYGNNEADAYALRLAYVAFTSADVPFRIEEIWGAM